MSKTKMQILFEEAATLPAADLEELASRLGVLSGVSGEETSASEHSSIEVMFDALQHAVTAVTGDVGMPYNVFRKTKLFPRFKRACHRAEQYIQQLAVDQLERTAVRRWCCALLIKEIQTVRKQPLKWAFITTALDDLPLVMDRNFPGYMASGLMTNVVQVLLGGKHALREKVRKEAGLFESDYNDSRKEPRVKTRNRVRHRRD